MSQEVDIQVLRTVPELEELRPLWESWPGSRDSELDFYLTVVGLNPEIVRPHVIVVKRGGRPDAILVGRIDRKPIEFRVGYLCFRPRADVLYFVYGALRGSASLENSELLVNEICQSLTRGEADVAYLNFLRSDSHIYRMGGKMPGFLNRDHIRPSQPHFTATIPKDAEQFYSRLSSKVRKNQRWQAKRLVSDFCGAVRIRCFREVAELDSMIRDVELVAKKTYQRGLGVGFVGGPETRARLQLGAQKGWLRAYVLYITDRPSAFWIGILDQGTFTSEYLGYDASLGRYSPGMYLIMKVIEDFCNGNEDRVTQVDFAIGYGQYKQVLSNREWQEACIYIFARSLKGMELNLIRHFAGGIDQALKRTLERTRLLQRIKKTWREHARHEQAKEM